MITTDELRTVEAFADLTDDELRWLAERAFAIELEAGDAIIEEGDPVDEMYAVLEGEFRLVRESGPPDDRWIVRRAGKISGMLPHSRMTHSPVAARALVRTRLAAWSSETVAAMQERIPVLRARLAQILLDRSREFARLDEQGQRLQSLGKLSAGLAHELNNPAAAIQRRVDELADHVAELGTLAFEGIERAVPTGATGRLRDLSAATSHPTDPPGSLLGWDALERADVQEALQAWLDERGVGNAWSIAETLASEGLTVETLDRATDPLGDAALPAARWLAAHLASRRLLSETADAARRIVDLIASVKAYSNLDRAPTRVLTDVNEGVRSTVTMLTFELRRKSLAVDARLDADLPPVVANAGELNQVWTNLIDNAIDASPEGGTIAIHTLAGADGVHVHVTDPGPGIPAELQARIFEPFFTTKDVGEGSGIGLDIVRRIVRAHGGEVHVDSEPGRTRFDVRLPASDAGHDAASS